MSNPWTKLSTKTRKLLKRILAATLAVVLVVGLGLSYSADRLLKATSIPEDEIVVEEKGEDAGAPKEETQEIEIEDKNKEEPEPEPEPEAPAEQETQPVETPSETEAAPESSDAPEQISGSEEQTESADNIVAPEGDAADVAGEQPDEELNADEQAEETAEEPETAEEDAEDEEEEEEIKYPAQKLSAKASDGAKVTIDAPEGALPEGCRVTITLKSSGRAEKALEGVIGDDRQIVDVVVYDIKILDKKGREIQPDSSVKVSITGAGVESGEEASLYHVDNGGGVSKVRDLADTDSVSFSASHFSEYAILTTNGNAANEPANYEVLAGESVTIPLPDGYSSYSTSWTTSDKKIATVTSSNGKCIVSGVKAGTVTITASYRSWTRTYSTEYTVRVKEPVTEPEISISPETVNLTQIGETKNLTAKMTAIDDENTIVWTSSNPAVATVENGVVTAVDEGNVTITASVSPEEDELYGNTYTAEAKVTVTFSEYNVYHYGLIPGASADAVGAAGANASWFGLGVTKVSGVANPSSLGYGAVSSSYKIGAAVNGKTLFPNLTYNGTTYRYAALGTPEAEMAGYYTVVPFRLVVASGANSGNNNYNGTAGGKTYHLDYMTTLNEKSYVSTSFVLKNPDSSSYEALMDYGQRFRAGTSQSQITKPTASAVPATKKYNGITYSFDGWYLDAGCTQKADFAGTIENNMTFYGRYVPTNAYYRVEYYYDGVIDSSLTERLGPANLGTVVTSYTDKKKTGFNLSEVSPASITVGTDEAENVIRVYYTKRLVTYKVCYYLNGTSEQIAPAVSGSARFGEEGKGTLKDIAGYTPVSDQKTKTAVIESAGTEIRFYYYKNTELTANSASFTYDGTAKYVNGYTADQDAVFENIEAKAEGTNAGSYDAVFSKNAVGSVDATERYIVTKVNKGILTIEPAAVTVTAADAGKAYGAADPELGAVISGLAAGDEGSITYTLTREAGEDPGTYPVHVTGEKKQGNYNVTYADGVFTISRSGELAVNAAGYEGIYDGQAHSVTASATVTDGTTISYSTDGGETWSEEAPSITDAGEMTVLIRAENKGYEPAETTAVLKVLPRPVTITASDAVKVFGTADPALTATVSGLIGEDTVDYSVSRDSGEHAGSYDVNVTADELQGNYTVSASPGVFTISKASMEIGAVSADKKYDGKPISGSISAADIPSGSAVSYSVDGGETWTDTAPERKDAGRTEYMIRIENPDYETCFISGSISVSRRSVILTSGSDTREYDGKELTNSEVSVSGDGFIEGEGASYEVTGKQTVVGTSRNTFTYTLNEGTSAVNYDVRLQEGKLEVTSRDAKFEIELVVNSGEFLYDGKEKTVSDFESLYFNINGKNYAVRGMEANLTETHAGSYEVVATGTPMVLDSEDNDVTDQFRVTTRNGNLIIKKRSVILTSASAEREYNGAPLRNENVTVSGDGFAAGEGAGFTVTGSRTVPGISENTFAYTLNDITSAGDYEITSHFGTLNVHSRAENAKYEITVSAPNGEFTYDGSEHSVNGLAEPASYTIDGHEYTVSGLSASAAAVNAGKYPVNVTGTAVVTDEEGNNVTSEFIVRTNDGVLDITKRSVVLTSASDSKRYNGSALTNDEVTVSGDGFADNEGAAFTVTGAQTLPGSSANVFTYALNEGTLADNYSITCEFGTLEVTDRDAKYEIRTSAKGGEFLYDGEQKEVSGIEQTEFEVEGHTYTLSGVKAGVTAVNAGTYKSVITGTPVVTDADGAVVTEQFSVHLEPADLVINPRNVVLTSADAVKQYDGKPLTNDEVSVSGDGFAEGEGVLFSVTGSRTLPGTSENQFTYTFEPGTYADNYVISSKYGRLLVNDRDAKFEVTLEPNSGVFKYDGKEHSVEGFKTTVFSFGGLEYTVDGMTAGASLKDAGTADVVAEGTPVVRDAEGNDVTAQFIVNVEPATLEITKRNVTLTSGSASKEYDGNDLTNDEVTVSGEGFAEGEGASFKVTGKQKTVGSSENEFTYELNEGVKAENYNIAAQSGSLTVTSRDAKYSIQMTANSGSYKYDGKKKTVKGFVTDTFEIEGNTYTVSGLEAEAEAKHAGTYPVNSVGTAVVTDEAGNDVTDQFAVSTVPGTLEITKRNVILTSANAERTYNGKPLTSNDVTVSGDGFAEGEGAAYNFTGTRTIVGFAANLFSYILNEGTAEGDYNISVIPGQLNVLGREDSEKYEISVKAASGSFMYDGEAHSVSGLIGQGDEVVTEGGLTYSVDGNTYTVTGLSASAERTDAGITIVNVSGTPVVTDTDGADVSDQFRVKAVSGALEITKRNVTLTSATESKEYDGDPLINGEVTATGDGFVEGEGASFNVTGSQTLVGSSENAFTYVLNAGTSADNYNITVAPGTLIVMSRDAKYSITVEANSGEYKYTGEERTVEGLRKDTFEVEGNTYTVSGLEAKASAADAGTYPVNVTGTPVVKDAAGNDVSDQFAVEIANGSLTINKRIVYLTSASDSRQYNGKKLTADEVTVSRDGFAEGEGAEFTVTGSQTLVGYSDNTFTYALNENTKAGNYEITVIPGVLTVTDREAKYEISLVPKSGSAVYDGQKHVVEGFEQTEFTFGDVTYTVSGINVRAAGTNAGTHPAVIEGGAKVTDSEGNDVTAQFIVNVEPRALEIAKRNVTLTSGSASKEYDGNDLTNDEVTVSGDGFAEGDGASFKVTGKQKTVGSSENEFTYKLNEGTNEDNYNITTQAGSLTVTNRDAKYSIQMTANSGTYKYDGKEKTAVGFVTDTFEIEGNTYTVGGLTANAAATHAGSYPVNAVGTAAVTDEAGNDVTDQFAVSAAPGTLEITKRNVILTSANAEKIYDGKRLTSKDVTVSGDGFADGEGAAFENKSGRTVVGTSTNSFTYTLNEGTNAGDYEIRTVFGSLLVTSRPDDAKYQISISAPSDNVMYDGAEHAVSGLIGPDGKASEDGSTVKFSIGGNEYTLTGLSASASASNAGQYTVHVTGTPVVRDAEKNDVTNEFIVTTSNGQLNIGKRNVTFTSASASKEYDGDSLTNGEVAISGDDFAEGEGASFSVTGSQTLVGTSENVFTYLLNAGTNANNYNISVVPGMLTVTNRDAKFSIKMTANSGSYKYDGKEKNAEGFVTDTFEIEGNTYTVSGLEAKASEKHAGTHPVNAVGTAVVKDEAGNDVTDQFAVSVTPGTLEITKRNVILTSADAERTYNGKPLTNNNVTVSGDGFAEGEGAAYNFTGTRTIVGFAANLFSYVLNKGTDEGDYNITVVPGQLNIFGRSENEKYEISVKAASGSFMYDGEAHAVSGLIGEGDEVVTDGELTYTVDGNTFTLTGLSADAERTAAGTTAVNVKGTPVVRDAEGNDVTEQFIVNREPGALEIAKRNVTLTSGSASKEYDGNDLANEEVTVSGDGFADGEGAAFNVTGSQTLVGTSENTFAFELNEETNADNYNISVVPGMLTVTSRDAKYSVEMTANSGTYKYDGKKKTAEGFVTDTFVIEGNTYTVSGLEAKAEATHAGSYAVNAAGTAVVTDASGNDVSDQFAVSVTPGTLEITKRNVILTSANAERTYNGKPLTSNDVTVSGDGFAEGEGAEYNFTGTRTIVGFAANLFSYILNDGTDEGDYNITVIPGELNVLGREGSEKYEISVKAASGSFMYDGEAHAVSGLIGQGDEVVTEGGLTYTVDGNTYTVTGLSASAERTDAGTTAVTVYGTPTVTDTDGADVSDQFRVKAVNGTLEITKRNVIFTSATESKEYDGDPLTNAEVAVSGDDFAEGEGASFSVTGSQTLVGSSENSFTYALNAGTNADNYNITAVPGTLTVTNRDAKYSITVEANSGEYKYTGAERTVEGFKADTFEVEGNTYTVSGLEAKTTATDAGTYPVNIVGTAVVTDEAGNDVSDQFAVETVNGSLTIGKRFVYLTSASASRQYNGTKLTADEVTVSRDGFAEGEGAEFTVTGSQTLVGYSDNRFTYALNENTKAENYEITVIPGVLTVTDREAKYEISLVPKTGNAVYDGQKHVVEGFEQTEFTFGDVTYTVSGINVRAAGTKAGTHPAVIEGGARVTDSEGNDVTSQFIIGVEPSALEIAKRNVTLTSGSASKEYDGNDLTNDEVTVSGEGFAEGEGASFKVTGKQKTVGSSENAFTYELNANTDADNYNITTQSGSLTVVNRDAKYSIQMTANSGTYKYDGKEKTVEGFVTDTFEIEGNTYTVSGLTAKAAATHAGSYPVNVVGTAVVTDEAGNDVTDQFAVSAASGTLEIAKRDVILTSANAEKIYDGKRLTSSDVTVSGDGFAEGEGAAFENTSGRTVVGTSTNGFTYTLNEGTNSGDYEITTVFGSLIVTSRPADAKYQINISAPSDSVMYDGAEHTLAGLIGPDGTQSETVSTVKFSIDGNEYTLTGLSASASAVNAGQYTVHVTGTPVVRDAEKNDVTNEFIVTTSNGQLNINKRNVTFTSGTASKEYDGDAVTSDEVTVSGDDFAEGEGASFSVSGSQTLVGSSENSFTYSLNAGTNANNYNFSVVPGTLTVTNRDAKYNIEVTANSGSYKYDGSEKTAEGIVTDTFEVEGNTYTVSGLTAKAAAADAGTYPVNIVGTAVVTDETGNDVSEQFAVSVVPGTLKITPRSVILTSGSAEKQYDGTALRNEDVEVSGDGFAEGEGASYNVTGSRLLVGQSANEFDYVLNSGTDAKNYEITKANGSLIVRDRSVKYEITLKANGGELVYDGQRHNYEGFEQTEFEFSGAKYTVSGIESKTTGKWAGLHRAEITGSPVVTDEAGNNVTAQFVVNVTGGDLLIKPRTVVLTSGSASKEFDGNDLTNEEVTVGGEGFAEGEGASFKVTGKQKTVGSSENAFTYELNEGVRAENYNITTQSGSLTVVSRDAKYSIEMTANSGTYKYDGKKKTAEGFVKDTFEIEGNTYTVSGLEAKASEKHAGSYPVNAVGTAVVKDEAGNDVTDQFAVSTVPGTLEITKRNVTLTSASAERTYNGKPLTSNDVTVSGDGFAEGEGAGYSFTGTRTIAGFAANLFSYILNEGTDQGDYNITVIPGQLNVLGREGNEKYEISVKAASGSFMYDGESHAVSGLIGPGEEVVTEGGLTYTVDGNTYTLTGLSASAERTAAGTTAVTVEGTPIVTDADGSDVSDQFRVKSVNGTLEVTRRNVILTSATESKEYDGDPLTNTEVTVSGDDFAEGEGASYSVTGRRTIVGSGENSFTYALNAGTNADNYNITVVPGTLTITNRDAKYSITVEANSGEYKYTGEERVVEGCKADTFEVEGNTYKVSGLEAKAAATDAGTYPVNIIGTAVVTDEAGNDVSDQFAVATVNGSLTIGKRTVYLTSASASRQYNGKKLTADEVTVSRDGFAEGEGAEFTVTGSQTLVGYSDNAFTYALNENTKAGNYEITMIPGVLSVTDRESRYEISLVPSSDSVLYDGQKHVVEGFEQTEFTFGDVTYTVSGINARAAGTKAGTHPVVIEGGAIVKDADGNDVTSQFIVNTQPAALEITKRNVTLTSGSASKEYDGNDLTNEEVSVSGDGFAEGEGASFKVTGKQKTVGSSENTFTYELNEGVRTENYNITTQSGSLTVVNRDAKYSIEMTANSGTYKYDGKEKTAEGFVTDTFEIEGNTYTVSGLTAAASGTHAGTYAVNAAGAAVVTDAAGNDVTDQFAVTTVPGTLRINKRNVILTSANAEKIYDGKRLTSKDVIVSGDGFAEGEGAAYENNSGRTIVGTLLNAFRYLLNEGTLASDYNIQTSFGSLTVTGRPDDARYEIIVKANGGEYLYDGEVHTAGGFIDPATGKALADDAALKYTINGSEYTVTGLTAAVSAVNAGSYDVRITGTPFVTDSEGNDVTPQFIVMTQDSKLLINRRNVIFTSASDTKAYDGNALANDEVAVTGDGFADGEGAEFNVTGSQTLAGSSENSFTYRLNEGTIADNYNISVIPGSLTVTNRDAKYNITVTANSGEFKYDGSEKTVEGVVSDTFEVEGNTYTVSGLDAKASGIHAGTYAVNVTGTPVVSDAAGNDVTDQFAVETVSGSLVITPRNITLTSGSAEKEYDGKVLTNGEVVTGGDGFADGEGAVFNVTGKRLLAGTSENTFTYTFAEGTNAANYTVTAEYGTLTVLSREAKYEISLKPTSDTVLYDGTEHSVRGWEKTEFEIGGVTYTVSGIDAGVSASDAGRYPVAVSGNAVVSDADGNDVTDQFRVVTEPAELVIRERNIILTSGSAAKQYDGDALANEEVTVTGDGFVEGEGASYEVTGSQQTVGSSENSFTYTLNDGTEPGNYNISAVPGLLTVTNRDAAYDITVTANSGVFKYDGSKKTVEGFVTEEFEIEGNTYTVSGLSAAANALHAGLYAVNVTGTPVVRDAAGNDVSDQFAVNAVPGTLEITKRIVRLTSADAGKTYDGDPLTDDKVAISGEGFAKGEGASYEVSGSRTVTGASENVFTYTLNEGTLASDYEVVKEYGMLTVTARPDDARFEINVKAAGGNFLYDGEEHTASGFEGAGEDGDLTFDIGGHLYTVKGLEASRTEVSAGSYHVNVTGTPVVLDESGNIVTSEFVINMSSNTLTIGRRQLTMTSGSSSHAYTGKPLTNDEVTVSGDGFAEGEGAEYDVTGSRTIVGISPNTFTYTLNEGTDSDNYVISVIQGELCVTDRDAKYLITLTPESAEYLYDGEVKTVSGFESLAAEIEGERYSISGLEATASATDAGEYPVTVSGVPVVTDAAGNDVSSQFAVETGSGTLTIRPRKVILMSGDVSREYDGTPLYGGEVTVSGDGFAEGDRAEIFNIASRTLVGVTENSFDWAFAPNTRADNYEVSTVFGLISITNRDAKYEILLVSNSDTVAYDGEEHSVTGFEETEFLIEDNTYSVSGVESSATGTEVGVYGTELSGEASISDELGADVTEEFAVSYESGNLTITPNTETPAATPGDGDTPDNGGTTPGRTTPDGGSDNGTPAEEDGTSDGGGEAATGNVGENLVPYATAPLGYWALVNLILMILSAVLAVIGLIKWIRDKNKDDGENGESEKQSYLDARNASLSDTEGSSEEDDRPKKQKGTSVIIGVILAIVSVIAFFFTEDLTNTMAYVDRYTVMMAVIFIGNLLAYILGRKKEKEEEDPENTQG